MTEQYQFIEIHGGPEDGATQKCRQIHELDPVEVTSIEDESGHVYRVAKVECGSLHLQYVGTNGKASQTDARAMDIYATGKKLNEWERQAPLRDRLLEAQINLWQKLKRCFTSR